MTLFVPDRAEEVARHLIELAVDNEALLAPAEIIHESARDVLARHGFDLENLTIGLGQPEPIALGEDGRESQQLFQNADVVDKHGRSTKLTHMIPLGWKLARTRSGTVYTTPFYSQFLYKER